MLITCYISILRLIVKGFCFIGGISWRWPWNAWWSCYCLASSVTSRWSVVMGGCRCRGWCWRHFLRPLGVLWRHRRRLSCRPGAKICRLQRDLDHIIKWYKIHMTSFLQDTLGSWVIVMSGCHKQELSGLVPLIFFYEITLLGVGGCISDPVGEEFRCRRPIHPLPERSTEQCRVASSRCYSGLASDCWPSCFEGWKIFAYVWKWGMPICWQNRPSIGNWYTIGLGDNQFSPHFCIFACDARTLVGGMIKLQGGKWSLYVPVYSRVSEITHQLHTFGVPRIYHRTTSTFELLSQNQVPYCAWELLPWLCWRFVPGFRLGSIRSSTMVSSWMMPWLPEIPMWWEISAGPSCFDQIIGAWTCLQALGRTNPFGLSRFWPFAGTSCCMALSHLAFTLRTWSFTAFAPFCLLSLLLAAVSRAGGLHGWVDSSWPIQCIQRACCTSWAGRIWFLWALSCWVVWFIWGPRLLEISGPSWLPWFPASFWLQLGCARRPASVSLVCWWVGISYGSPGSLPTCGCGWCCFCCFSARCAAASGSGTLGPPSKGWILSVIRWQLRRTSSWGFFPMLWCMASMANFWFGQTFCATTIPLTQCPWCGASPIAGCYCLFAATWASLLW